MNKYQEALDLMCDENYELDVFLEKYPQVQMNWNSSKGFKNHIEKITIFENKYGNMPAKVIQELVDKQTPMKPIENHYEKEGDPLYIKCVCPRCKGKYQVLEGTNYCFQCGQKLDWGTSNGN